MPTRKEQSAADEKKKAQLKIYFLDMGADQIIKYLHNIFTLLDI